MGEKTFFMEKKSIFYGEQNPFSMENSTFYFIFQIHTLLQLSVESLL